MTPRQFVLVVFLIINKRLLYFRIQIVKTKLGILPVTRVILPSIKEILCIIQSKLIVIQNISRILTLFGIPNITGVKGNTQHATTSLPGSRVTLNVTSLFVISLLITQIIQYSTDILTLHPFEFHTLQRLHQSILLYTYYGHYLILSIPFPHRNLLQRAGRVLYEV